MIYKKKFLLIALATTFMLIYAPASIQASQVHVTIDGRQVNFTDQGPTIVDDRTLIPVRGVFEELGFEVDWEQDTETARLARGSYEVVLTIGNATFITNGESHSLDVPAQIIGGRTMLPIRAVLESVGYFVDWSQATNTVLISSSSGQGTNVNRFSHSDGIDENGFWEGVTALDYVEIFDYDNLEIPNDVSDRMVEQEIQSLLYKFFARVMDRAVVIGDVVNIDFVRSVNGVVSDSGSTNDIYVVIGVTGFIDYFEQLIGHKPGDTVNVKVYPDEFPQNESIQGEDVLFAITINYICSQESSELTDKFVLENLYEFYGWATIREMEEGLRREFQELSIRSFVENYIRNEVNVSSIPEKLRWYFEQSLISIYKGNASRFDMTLEEYLEIAGYDSLDELLKEIREMNWGGARRSLILQAVAEHGGFSVSLDEIGDFYEANFGTRDYSSFVEELGLPYIIKIILHEKVFDHIVENAVLL